jgi:hypothetical protein
MADAYGTFIVCGDYEGDLDAIAEVLNSLRLNQDDAQFSVDDDEGIIGLDSVGVQYPTVFPSRKIYVFGDGGRVFADESYDSVVEQWEAEEDGDLDSESYSLEELSDLISPHLTKGTIELVAVANEKNRYAYYDRLIIRSDGSAERRSDMSDALTRGSWNTQGSDQFDPSVKKRVAKMPRGRSVKWKKR